MDKQLVKDFLEAKKSYREAEKKLSSHFNAILDKELPQCKTADDFQNIKWKMADMPDSASKVLIFRRIILTQDKVLKG